MYREEEYPDQDPETGMMMQKNGIKNQEKEKIIMEIKKELSDNGYNWLLFFLYICIPKLVG